ncbi:Bud-site selection protein [Crassisporium funariophilum]|nr:Bud-site selection protein [Crassisporium funariophilum]
MDNDVSRGVKRKRYEPPEEDMSIRVGRKLEVHKASKRAKVFAIQTVVKKLKDLNKKGDDSKTVGEYEAELTSLKGVDHDVIGNTALKTKVLKDHTLRENEDVKATLANEVLLTPAEPGTTLAKIQNRLLSSKILAAQVVASLESLKVLLNPALKHRDLDTDAHVTSEQPVERPSKIRRENDMGALQSKKQAANTKTVPDNGEEETNLDMNDGDAGWESGSVGEDEESGDGWESGSLVNEKLGKDDDDDGASDQTSEHDDDELKVRPSKAPLQKPPAKAIKASASVKESTFLPSLSVGFVRGGSDDSDWSETEDKAADTDIRKNRRGQRARRLIWEKKFGRNANHKKKEAEEVAAQATRKNKGHTKALNSGSNAIQINRSKTTPDASRAAARHPKSNLPHQPPVDAGWGTHSAGGSAGTFKSSAPRADKAVDRPLHPSWEAKRRMKEKESVGIVPSQGKKIKF